MLHCSLLALGVLMAGCGGTKSFHSAYDKKEIATRRHAVTNREDLTAALQASVHKHDELWAKSDVVVRQKSIKKKTFFTALLLFRSPDQVRLRGSRVPIGTVFEVLLLGRQAMIYINQENRLFTGDISELASKTEAIGGLTPRELLAAVFVQQDLLERLEGEGEISVTDKEDHLLIAALHPINRRQLFWQVRKADGLVEELLIRSPEGAEQLRIKYREYSMEEDSEASTTEPLPTDFVMNLAGEDVEVSVEVNEYKLSPKLKDAVFFAPKARETYRLRDLQFKEQ